MCQEVFAGLPKFLRRGFFTHGFKHAVLTSWPASIAAGRDVAGDHPPKKVRFGGLNPASRGPERVKIRSIKICLTREVVSFAVMAGSPGFLADLNGI